MTLNRACIGKPYPPVQTAVRLDAMQQYAAAYSHSNPRFFNPKARGGLIAPPMFGVTLIWQSLLNVFTDSHLHADLLRLVHSEHDASFLLPIVPGDLITSSATIMSIETQPSGESVLVELPAHNQRGELVQTTRFTALIRGLGSGRAAREVTIEHGAPLLAAAEAIPQDQTTRYAQASGDFNPIHLNPEVARAAGLPGIIVHGLCTMAICSKIAIERLGDSDPLRLRRLHVRFARPVLPGQTITLRAWPAELMAGGRRYYFDVLNPTNRAVIRDGLAEMAGPG